jgi:hypothetical protein
MCSSVKQTRGCVILDWAIMPYPIHNTSFDLRAHKRERALEQCSLSLSLSHPPPLSLPLSPPPPTPTVYTYTTKVSQSSQYPALVATTKKKYSHYKLH